MLNIELVHQSRDVVAIHQLSVLRNEWHEFFLGLSPNHGQAETKRFLLAFGLQSMIFHKNRIYLMQGPRFVLVSEFHVKVTKIHIFHKVRNVSLLFF